MPDTWGQENFGVDHYRPKQQFPELIATYSNLYYCCNPCNSRKGHYWPSSAKAKDSIVPNPCDHSMAGHLRYKVARVEAKTKAGAITSELLDLNAPDAIKKRTLMLEMIKQCKSNKAESLQLKKVINRKIIKGTVSTAVGNAQLAALDGHITHMDKMINQLAGAE